MIRSVIVDDNEKNIAVLRALIKTACPQVVVCGEARNADQGMSVIRGHRPDLVFLDIEMPYDNGFDMLERLHPLNFEVIFVTAFSQYSLKAFRYQALDYLLKPVDLVELSAAVDRASDKILSKQQPAVQKNIQPDYEHMRIALPVKEGYDVVNVADIVRCEVRNNCTSIFLRTGQKYVCSRTLTEYETLLPSTAFFRVHHGHLLNFHYVRKYYKQGRGGYVELMDGTLVEVSVRKKDEFLKKLGS